MNRDELIKSGLLEQYVLGLTEPDETAMIEAHMAEDPFVADEVDKLRKDIQSYADHSQIMPPPDGRPPRSIEDMQLLDHEMIMATLKRNGQLNTWRFVLLGVCILLVTTAGYLWRLKESYRQQYVTEHARYVQEHESHLDDLRHSREEAIDWNSLGTSVKDTEFGPLLIHLVPGTETVLFDFSHTQPLENGAHYLLTTGKENREITISESRRFGLFSVEAAKNEIPEFTLTRRGGSHSHQAGGGERQSAFSESSSR